MIRVLTFLLFLALPAFSQEIDAAEMLTRLRACYNPAETVVEKRGCPFTIADTCQAEIEGGFSTLGISWCNQAEAKAWDVLLNEEYTATMKYSRAADTDEAELFPGLDGRADTLRSAQRAWITYRDAACLNEYAQWGAGSQRHIAGSGCLLRMTAERTIEIWQMRNFFE